MAYIIGLFLVLAIIFSVATGNNIGSSIWDQIKQKTNDFIFPKSEKEILIDNLRADYNLMDKFFSESTNSILKSKDISENDKSAVREAVQVFQDSKTKIANLGNLEKNNPGILKAVIQKAVDLIIKPKPSENPQPTAIPPQCRLVCSDN